MTAKAKKDTPPPQPELGFEEALEELEGIVAKMEDGEMGLDKMVDAFERGQQLVKQCTSRLNEVEKRIELLIKGANNEPATTPLDAPELLL